MAKAKEEKPLKYKALATVYVNERLYGEGEEFEFSGIPSIYMEPIGHEVDIEAMKKEALFEQAKKYKIEVSESTPVAKVKAAVQEAASKKVAN